MHSELNVIQPQKDQMLYTGTYIAHGNLFRELIEVNFKLTLLSPGAYITVS